MDSSCPNINCREWPRIDVIVRVADRPLVFVLRAFGSILAQTRVPASVVVVNTGKTPEGWSAFLATSPLGAIPLRLTSLPSPGPMGNRSEALNTGIAHATAEWVAFLDDDDTWHPNFLERVGALLMRGPDGIGGVVTRTESVYEKLQEGGLVELKRRPFNGDLTVVDLADLVVSNRFTLNAMVVARKVFAEVGGYRENLPVLEDWEFNVRAAARFHFEVIPDVLACYHIRPAGGLAANTGHNEHLRVATLIRNEWIRVDLAAGRIGLGQLSLLGEVRGMAAVLGLLLRLRMRLRVWCGRHRA